MSQPTKSSFQETVANFLHKNIAVIIALSLSLLSGLFFLAIGYPEVFQNIAFFRQRWFGLAFFGVALLITYIACFYSGWTLKRGLSVWVQSNLLLFFGFAYFLRLNNSPFKVFSLDVNTGLIFIPLTLLIFAVNYLLFSGRRLNTATLLPQVLLFTLYSYSFIGFLDVDRTFARNFSQDWLALLFNIPSFIWLLICSLSISLITVLNVAQSKSGKLLFFGGVLFILLTQILIGIESLGTTYWYHTLLALVTWDFLFGPFKTILAEVKDSKYQPRLVVSTIYHLVIFTIILIFI